MTQTLNINIKLDENRNISLINNDYENLILYLKAQRPWPFINEQNDYTASIEAWANHYWRYLRYLKLYDNLPAGSKILDVGSGSSILDLIAAKYVPDSTFYLLDKNEMYKQPFVWYGESHVFYHSWKCVTDFFNLSDLDPSRFHFMNETSEWPEQLDVITSFFSWGFHYPLENKFNYWEKTLKNLKIGGKFYIDISNNNLEQNPHTIELVSEILGSTPIITKFDDLTNNKNYIIKDGKFGQGCLWIRNK